MVFKVINQLSRTMGVYNIELNTLGDGMPFEIKECIEITGFFPSLLPKFHTTLYNLRVVAWTHDIL